MKPDYNNWVPKWLLTVSAVLTAVFFILFLIFGVLDNFVEGTVRTVLGTAFFILFIVFLVMTLWYRYARGQFSYDGKRKLAKDIIEFTAEHVDIKDGGKGLDIGCGSGALAIAVAKRNPDAKIIGLDRWGTEYSNFNKNLCEKNAAAEGVSNTEFVRGDAVKLDFPDESFDSVFSNYVYHNIKGKDRQELLLETLRVLKKGGTFAIHDLFTKHNYGDMDEFAEKLKKMGYQKVELVDTANGSPMEKSEARKLLLSGSKLLYGIK